VLKGRWVVRVAHKGTVLYLAKDGCRLAWTDNKAEARVFPTMELAVARAACVYVVDGVCEAVAA